jgi:hypothetical protein
MAREPWFKFFAADYLLDPAVDELSLEAQAVLLRMWCICHIEGSCPVDVEQIARKTRLPFEAVARHRERVAPFFEARDGHLFSRRMEEEKRRSEIAQRGGNKRGEQLRSANRSADSLADCSTQSQSQSQSQSPPALTKVGSDLSLQKKLYSQTDFDERDLRKYTDERRKVELKLSNGWGADLTNNQIFDYICARAGLTAKHMREVFARIDGQASA